MSTNGHPTVTDTLRMLEQAVASAPLEDLPMVLGRLEMVKALGWGRMLATPQQAQPEKTGKQAMTAEDVAPILNVKLSMVYELVRTKRLKAYKVGKYIRFKEADVRDFLAQGGA